MALSKFLRVGVGLLALGALAACDDDARLPRNARHYVPIPGHLISLMGQKGTTKFQPVLFRAYKKESELEVWKLNHAGEYVHLKTYPMCRWSGQLGPKIKEGDRQVPEGFYTITQNQLNPNSSFYLSFNVGYPNAFDRAHGRTGSAIMVHGACSSMGCFSMTDEQIAEIYALTREAFAGGQTGIQLQSFPFRFTPENMAKYRADPNMPFWKMLKEGADSFDVSKKETQVAVCDRRYVFNRKAKDGARFEATSACPPSEVDETLTQAVAAKRSADDTKVAALVAAGAKAMRRIYKDGDQHEAFKVVQMSRTSEDGQRVTPVRSGVSAVEVVSRPDDLEHGPVDLTIEELKGRANKPARELAAALHLIRAESRPAATTASAPVRNASPVPARATATASTPARPAAAQSQAAATPAFAPAPQPAASKPFYQGWLGGWGSSASETPAAVQAQEPSQPQRSNVPAPRPRADASGARRTERTRDASPLIERDRSRNSLVALRASQ
jgi:murein L,D-transpeptidase YafK